MVTRDDSSLPLSALLEAHSKDINAVIDTLTKVTGLPESKVKSHFDKMLSQLVKKKQDEPFKKLTSEERRAAFHEWVESHRSMNLPHLTDEQISRDTIYEHRG